VGIQAKLLIGLLMILILFFPIAEYFQNLTDLMFRTIENVLTLLK